MLSNQYKLPLERYKYDAPYLGFATCCGELPKVDFDVNHPNAMYNVGHMACLKCNGQLGVVANGDGILPDRVGFLYQNWNRHHANQPLHNMPQGFFWSEATIEYMPHGSKESRRKHFVILKIDGRKVFNYCLHRQTIVELEFPVKYHSASFTTSEVSCTDGTRWPTVYFTAYNGKWKSKLEDFLIVNLDERPRRW